MNKKILLYLSIFAGAVGMYMHTRSRQKTTPKTIWQAAAQGNLASVKNFVQSGVALDSVDNEKRTPLIIATQHKHLEVMNYFLQKKADVNMQDKEGMTALMYAAKEGLDDMVMTMVAHGGNINAMNKEHESALMEAADEGYPNIVQELLGNAANADINDNDKETALLKAIRELPERLRERKANKTDITQRYMKVIELLIPKTNNVNLKIAMKATKDTKIKALIQQELDNRQR